MLTPELAAHSTGPGVTVSGPAIRHGVMPGTGLTAWEIENNKFVKGTVSGCGGTATWAFQPGDSFFDSSKQGKGRLYVSEACWLECRRLADELVLPRIQAWYRTQVNNKVSRARLRLELAPLTAPMIRF